ncbi:MAG: hypothetical protein IH874_04025 [Candidatus Dadabacteria bacterium]|nr:hypothetical protein [Candidatus Dadabacteria bacterium]
MPTTEQIEDAIITKLQTDVTAATATVEPFPDRPQDYILSHPKGAVLVQYRGSQFTEPRVVNTITQTRTLEFVIVVVFRNLRSHQGAYGVLDSVRSSLTGYVVTTGGQSLSKMFPVREGFIAEKSGVWWYGMTFRMNDRHTE